MMIIYLHGLDSSSNAKKALITQEYASARGIQILRPDLNCPPSEVLTKVQALLAQHPEAVLIGSSLGGYFANLLSDLTGAPAILLNPSIRPDISFERFLDNANLPKTLTDDTLIYTTSGGWQVYYRDLAWFERHRLTVKYPTRPSAIKNG